MDDTEIDRTFAEWKAAGRRGDAEAMAALVTEDAELWSSGSPARTHVPVPGNSATRRV